MWAVDVTTGARRMVTDDNAVQPAWSPHGSRIAYWKVDSSGNRDIYTVPAAGGEHVAVTRDAYTDWSPAWSPDGRFLFFSSDRGGSMNLWRVRVDETTGLVTGPFEPVTMPALNSGLLSFSRDGSHLAYVAQTTARNVMHVAFDPRLRRVTGPVTPVTRGTRYLRFPSASPDGRSIAYTSDEKLVVSHIDGSAPRQLTDGAYRDRAPRWSPDGSTLLFYTNRTGSYEIWAIHPDGSGLRQVTFGGDAVTFFYPVWSPDGRAVAFGDLRNRSSYVYTIGDRWSLPPASPPPPTEGSVFAPWSWSRSAGLAGWALGENGQSGGLLVFAPDTGVYRRLPVVATRPLWLPGDTHLVAHQSEGLLVVDAQTGATTPLVLPAVVDEEFTLSPDGSSIYFMQSERTGDIWLMSLGSANRTQP
jgi:Tol biopolymer transport system component